MTLKPRNGNARTGQSQPPIDPAVKRGRFNGRDVKDDELPVVESPHVERGPCIGCSVVVLHHEFYRGSLRFRLVFLTCADVGEWDQPVPRGLSPGRCSFLILITVYVCLSWECWDAN